MSIGNLPETHPLAPAIEKAGQSACFFYGYEIGSNPRFWETKRRAVRWSE
jgi:hypothetical protein